MSMQKVLLMGPHNGGKTSMRSVIFANFLARDTSRLGATVETMRSHVKILGSFLLNMWDCGGQTNYIRGYLDKQRQQTFSNVAAMVYVCDGPVLARAAEEDAAAEVLADFKETLAALREHSAGAHVFVLMHKADLMPERDAVVPSLEAQIREHLFAEEEAAAAQGAPPVPPPTFFSTTIWDDSLFKAWSSILRCLLPNLDILESYLRDCVQQSGIAELAVIDASTLLTVASVVADGETPLEASRVTSALKSFKLSCTKSRRSFAELVVVSRQRTILIERLTANTMVMLVARNTSPEVARLQAKAVRTGLGPALDANGPDGSALRSVL